MIETEKMKVDLDVTDLGRTLSEFENCHRLL